MPIYEYICTDCGTELEVIQKFSDAPLEKCEACSGALRKKISPSAFHLKGTGWYLTDYARKTAGGNGGNGNSTSPATTEKSAAAGTEASAPAKSADSGGDKSVTSGSNS